MVKYICGIAPGEKSRDIIARDHKIISKSLTRVYSLVIEKAKGCYLYDAEGKKHLDFAAGIAVANVGHTNDDVVKAVKKQADKAFHIGFSDYYSSLPVKFSELLLSLSPKKFNQVFLSNSGTESVEAALKVAKWHTRKKYFIAFENAFHGRTMGSLSLTKSKPVHRRGFEPLLPVKHTPYAYCYRCKFNKSYESCSMECLDALENTIKKVKDNVAAVFMEPIQGEGGYVVPPDEFVKGVRKLCNDHDIILAADEVQSGCYRTGPFLAMENFKVEADIVSLSKAIGGGIPIGATISTKKIMNWESGAHANTFGGNLLACSGGIASLNYMKKHKLGDNAKKIGSYILRRLNEMKDKYRVIGDVRGKGLMIGVEFVKDKKSKRYAAEERDAILCDAYRRGLVLLHAGKSAVRICPPLIITKKEAEKGLNIFEAAVKKISKGY